MQDEQGDLSQLDGITQNYIDEVVKLDDKINDMQNKIVQKQEVLDKLRQSSQYLKTETVVKLSNQSVIVQLDDKKPYLIISLIGNIILVLIIAYEISDIIVTYKFQMQ